MPYERSFSRRSGKGNSYPFTPDSLGEIYEYFPSLTEPRVAAGIFSLGFLVFTLMLKIVVPITAGKFRGTT